MKILLSFSLLILFFLVACGNNVSTSQKQYKLTVSSTSAEIEKDGDLEISNTYTQNKSCCIPDSNIFFLKQINSTIDKNDILIVRKLKNLDQEQIEAWINPIPEKEKYRIESEFKYYKAVSFQKRISKYSVVLLMMVEDMGEDYVTAEQVLITVDSSGKYIDGIPVSYLKNLSNSSIELDSIKNVYIFSTDVSSTFIGDTIKVYQVVDVSKSPDPHTDEAIWHELYETIYLIQPDGEISIARESKKLRDW